METNRKMKKQNCKSCGAPCGVRLNAMPFRTDFEARKCNHWATGGLLEIVRNFNGTYSVCTYQM